MTSSCKQDWGWLHSKRLGEFNHWNVSVVMMPNLSSLAAPVSPVTTKFTFWQRSAHWRLLTGNMASLAMSPYYSSTLLIMGRGSVDCLGSASGKTGKLHESRWFYPQHGTKSPQSPLDAHINVVRCRDILQKTQLPVARPGWLPFQEDSARPHHARIFTAFLQIQAITKTGQPLMSPDCNPIDHPWDKLGDVVNRIDNFPHNQGVLRQALFHKKAQLLVERL